MQNLGRSSLHAFVQGNAVEARYKGEWVASLLSCLVQSEDNSGGSLKVLKVELARGFRYLVESPEDSCQATMAGDSNSLRVGIFQTVLYQLHLLN